MSGANHPTSVCGPIRSLEAGYDAGRVEDSIMIRTVAAAVVLVLPTPSPAQTVVQGGGDALRRALQNANHGDVLLVLPETYRGFRTGLGVTIVCQPGVYVWDLLAGAVWVDGLPAGRTFAMVGGTTIATDFADNVRVGNCQGAVVFDGVTSSPGRQSRVTNSAAVTFHGCTLFGPDVADSTVAFVDTVIGPLGVFAGIRAARSDVFVAGGIVHGSDVLFPTIPATPGIALAASTLTVAGDGSTTVAAGIGPSNPPAILGDAGSRVVVGPRVRILSAAPVPVVAGSSTVRETPAVSLSGLMRTLPHRVDTITEPGALVATFVDTVRAPVRSPFGLLWISSNAIVADAGTAPASGVRSFHVPASVPIGSAFTLQAGTLLGSGVVVFGPPAAVVAF